MERTKYFNYTKPSQTQLNYTEESRARSILKRQRSSSQMGIRTGFRITVNNAEPTKIDIGPGEGYTGGYFTNKNLRSTNAGEVISTLTSTVSGSGTKSAQALANYINGTKNYISLVYSETESNALVENRIPWTSHDTIVSEDYTVEALDETDWLALSDDDLENRILVAIVTAKGAGVALTTADIQQVIQPNNHPYAKLLVTMTAITVSQVSDETIIGNGTIRWDPATNMIYWSAPGDSEGAGTSVTANGTYYVYSNTISFFIKIVVVYADLPAVETSETVYVRALYGRDIPMYSSVDQAHRDMVGTGTVSTSNPHGTSINDISGGPLDHAKFFHVNGISKDADGDQLECALDTLNDRVSIKNKGGVTNSFLIEGITYDLIAGYTALNSAYINFNSLADGEYIIFLDDSATATYARMSDTRIAADATFGGKIHIVDIKNSSSGPCSLDWVEDDHTLTFTGVDASPGTPVYVETSTTGTYYKLYSDDPLNYLIIYVDAILVGSGDYTFAFNTEFGEDDYKESSVLKVGAVDWDSSGELLSDLKDLRRFNTADNRVALEEEHDSDGKHNKVLQHEFRAVVDEGPALNGSAVSGAALYGRGGNPTVDAAGYGCMGIGLGSCNVPVVGLFGYASNADVVADAIGLWGSVDDVAATGVYGDAANGTGVYGNGVLGVYGFGDTGVFGSAGNTAVKGIADGSAGVYGQAQSYGIIGTANVGDYAGSFKAAGNTGIYGEADNRGVVGSANVGNFGGSFKAAGDTGACGEAVGNIGVYGAAQGQGVKGTATVGDYGGSFGAAGNIGVYGAAQGQGVKGSATVGDYGGSFGAAGNTGAYAAAQGKGIVGTATNGDYGGSFGAAANTGIYAAADNFGVYGSATNGNYGGIFGANVNIGISAAAQNRGVVGNASNGDYGGSFVASNSFGVYGYAVHTGIQGIAVSEIGVYGEAKSFGVAGVANDGNYGGSFSASGNLGVYGKAKSQGVYGEAVAGNTGVFGYASSQTGVFGSADSGYGVVGSAANGDFGGSFKASAGTGVYGEAKSYGVYGTANSGDRGGVFLASASTGVYGSAGTNFAIYGDLNKAGGTCIYGVNTANGIALYANCPSGTGIYCVGGATGFYALADNTAVYGKVTTNYCAIFSVTNTIADYNANIYGVSIVATAQKMTGTVNYVWGLIAGALNDSHENCAVGIDGWAPGSSATGILGYAISGTGIKGAGYLYGMYASGSISADIGCENGKDRAAFYFNSHLDTDSIDGTLVGLVKVSCSEGVGYMPIYLTH